MLDRAPPEPPPHPPRLTGLRGTLDALRNFGLVGLGTPGAGEFDSFTASDGQLVPVYVLGKGPPLVLVHGVGCSHRDWMPVARRLARRHCVLAWDARGHGSCRPVLGSITLARLAADLAEMLDHFGLQRSVLVGHSMGALTLMQYLHLYGTQRVAAVALVDQSPRIVTDDSWRLGLFGGCSATMLSGLIAGARQDLAEMLLNEVGAFGGAWLKRQLSVEAVARADAAPAPGTHRCPAPCSTSPSRWRRPTSALRCRASMRRCSWCSGRAARTTPACRSMPGIATR